MKQLSRVVWSEGMHLAPHHFQVQSRYFEDTVRFSTDTLWFAGYGLIGCELDAEALKNGTVSLIHARGILPDGLLFHIPECDPAPAPRHITDLFSPVGDRMTMCLAIPAHRPDAAICALTEEDQTGQTRYIGDVRTVHDENTGRDEKSVRVGRKNLRLLLESELDDGLVNLPIARVMRDGTGHFAYDPDFIPPCVRIAASRRLEQILYRLIDILQDKSSTLAPGRLRGGGEMAVGFSQQEVTGFWFLHCVNSALASLRNLCLTKKGHPEEVFVELSRLAGALCTFSLDSRAADLPLYDHNRLEQCFGDLDHRIRLLLEAVIPTSCLAIPLEKSENYFYAGGLADERVLAASRWIFSIRTRGGEAELIRQTPDLVKICSDEFVHKLVERAIPGLTLTHLQVPPSAVSPRVGYQYFGINKSGPCWDHLVKTRRVGVYVPGEFPDPEIGLHVIIGS